MSQEQSDVLGLSITRDALAKNRFSVTVWRSLVKIKLAGITLKSGVILWLEFFWFHVSMYQTI